MILLKGSNGFKSGLFAFCIFFLILIVFGLSGVRRVVSSHSFDLNYRSIYDAQFRVYILTHACGRFTETIAAAFGSDSVHLVPDIEDSPACAALDLAQLHLTQETHLKGDDAYRDKYTQVLEHCHRGSKMKCLILEDDIVLLHDPARTREVLVENTLSMFGREDSAYDCTKRGFGWLSTKNNGNGSQCRIYSKTSVPCMAGCLRIANVTQLDYGLGACQIHCGLTQKRFLLAVHSGLQSTMTREQADSS